MPTRKALERLAEQAERDRVAWQARADAAERQRDAFRALAAEATERVLHTRSQSASLKDVNDVARLNMSRANSDDPFVKACRAKNLTQNDVAKRIGVPRSLLSMYRSGVRKIPQDRAEAIEKLTGWKATAKNWPGGVLAAD